MVVPPIVHINGTSRDELLRLRFEAIDALEEAGRKLAHAAPNARDYYPESGRWELAMICHDTRMKLLRTIISDIEEEIAAIEGDTK